jgi:hypothetical protein
MYLKYKEEQRRFVKLARRMAIIEANLNKHNKKK